MFFLPVLLIRRKYIVFLLSREFPQVPIVHETKFGVLI